MNTSLIPRLFTKPGDGRAKHIQTLLNLGFQLVDVEEAAFLNRRGFVAFAVPDSLKETYQFTVGLEAVFALRPTEVRSQALEGLPGFTYLLTVRFN